MPQIDDPTARSKRIDPTSSHCRKPPKAGGEEGESRLDRRRGKKKQPVPPTD